MRFIDAILQEFFKEESAKDQQTWIIIEMQPEKNSNHYYKLYHHLMKEIATSYIIHDWHTCSKSKNGDIRKIQHKYTELKSYTVDMYWTEGRDQMKGITLISHPTRNKDVPTAKYTRNE